MLICVQNWSGLRELCEGDVREAVQGRNEDCLGEEKVVFKCVRFA